MTDQYPETNEQFLARMVLTLKEGDQFLSEDARRLADLAKFGRNAPTTMPEERRSGSKPLTPLAGESDLVTG